MKDAVDIYVKILIAILGFFVPTINLVFSTLLEKFMDRWRTAIINIEKENEQLKMKLEPLYELIKNGSSADDAKMAIDHLKAKTTEKIEENQKVMELIGLFTVKGQYKAHIANVFIQLVFSLAFVVVFYLVDKQVFYSSERTTQVFVFMTTSISFFLLFVFAAIKNRKLVKKGSENNTEHTIMPKQEKGSELDTRHIVNELSTNKIAETAQIPYNLFALIAFCSIWLSGVFLNAGINAVNFRIGEATLLLFSLIFATLGVENLRKITWNVIDVLQSDSWASQPPGNK